MLNILRYLFHFILFFTLFYFESFKLGSFSFSQLWKIPLVIYLFSYLLSRRDVKESYVFWGILFALIQLLNADLLHNANVAVTRFCKFADLPLLTYFICTIGFPKDKIWRLSFLTAQYFILSTLPFLTGFLSDVVSTDNFDFGNFTSRTYFFQSMHAAAIILSFSVLVIAHKIKEDISSKSTLIYNSILLVIGVYAVYASFARTGMLMMVLGLIILFLPSGFRIREVCICIIGLLFLGFFFYYQFEHNPDFVNRIFDNNNSGVLDTKRVGSGRFVFIENGIKLFSSGSFFNQMFGFGSIAVQEFMKKSTGMYIGLHNGFADALVMNGFLGFFFFLKMLYAYIVFVRRRKHTSQYRLLMAFFIAFLTCQFTQGNIGFGMDLFTALIVAYSI